MRTLVRAVAGVFVALLWIAAASAGNPLVGDWSSAQDWENRQAGIYSVLAIRPDGHIRVRVIHHAGIAYDLSGTYRLDASGRTMRFVWTDYSPKEICAGGNCTPIGPAQPLRVPHTSRIRFRNPNYFIGATDDGTSTNWFRMH